MAQLNLCSDDTNFFQQYATQTTVNVFGTVDEQIYLIVIG